MNDDDDRAIALPASCPVCSGKELYVRRISSGGGYAPYYLAGLGKFFHNAHFDVVVCAGCGLTQFFAEPLARRNVRNHPDWQRIDGPYPDGPDDDSAPTRCLDCRAVIPAGADTCPQCGWTYKGENSEG